jgi:glyoxylase-like metal-dependent hydrolase (beta-lactamase superfamily II)
VAFLTEPAPEYGVAIEVVPGVRRIVAPNPGPMTYHGTNSWLIEGEGGVTIIDPGPDDASHVAALVAAAEGRVARIVLTHTHPDHVGAAPALQAATGAPTAGYARPWQSGFHPDEALEDGDDAGDLIALHTPGHASDHLCFAWRDGVVFTGDHVMSWNTSIVSPPDGDMTAYMDGLRRLLAREDTLYLGGHGPPLPEPRALVRAMLGHRMGRESAIMALLNGRAKSPSDIVDALYGGIDPRLKKAAERTVLAHLLKLRADGRAAEAGGGWQDSQKAR